MWGFADAVEEHKALGTVTHKNTAMWADKRGQESTGVGLSLLGQQKKIALRIGFPAFILAHHDGQCHASEHSFIKTGRGKKEKQNKTKMEHISKNRDLTKKKECIINPAK